MITWFIIKIILGKDVEAMAIIYATLIVKGKKEYADVPARMLKEQVKEILIDSGMEELVTE